MRIRSVATGELSDDRLEPYNVLALLFYCSKAPDISHSSIRDSLRHFEGNPEYAEITRPLLDDDAYPIEYALLLLRTGQVVAENGNAYRMTDTGTRFVEHKLLGFVHDSYFPLLRSVSERIDGTAAGIG